VQAGRKTRCLLLLAAGATLVAGPWAASAAPPPGKARRPPAPAGAQAVVSLEDFHRALDPLGTWFVHPRWGQVWRPASISNIWKPYTRGHWARTDGGWYWVSDEPWAWATYHFGRWFLDPLIGWLWAPGRRWAPAWVQWREGKGLAGWAPLGPDGRALATHYTFVPAERILEPAEEVALPSPRMGQALRDTRPVTVAPQAVAARSSD